jgi:hypothetical protein
MSELDPETGIIRSVSEAQIIEDFKKYEEITITRLDAKRVKATFQEVFGEGSAIGDSVLNVLIAAVRRQKNQRYWDGYKAAEEKAKEEMLERMDLLQNLIEAQAVSIAMLRETTDTAIKRLAGHVSHLAQQFSIDHNQRKEE